MLPIHPLQLLRIEDRRFGMQPMLAEALDHLRHLHHFLVVTRRPTHQCEEVEHRLRQKPQVLIIAHGRRAMTLRQFLAVGTMNHRHVTELRHIGVQRAIQQDLLRRIRDVIVAAHHERNAHRDVVTHHGHVVHGRTVGTEDDEVLDVLVREGDALVHQIMPLGIAVGHLEADRVRLVARQLLRRLGVAQQRRVPVESVRLAAGLGLVAQPLGLRRRREIAIGRATVEQTVGIGVVPVDVGTLVHDLLVPREAEPLEPLENGASAFVGAAGAIGVFDAQQEVAVELLRVQPVEEGGTRAADMEKAGR